MKKIFAVVMCTVFALSLGACSSQPAVSNEGELPYRKLVVMYPFIALEQKDKALVEAEINKYLKEKINAEISMQCLDFNSHASKWPLMLQTNEQIDLLWLKGTDIIQNIPRQAFEPLDDLLAQHGKGVTSLFDDKWLDAVKMYGKVYALPAYKELAINGCTYYDVEVAERNNIDYANLATFEQLDQALATISANDPDIDPLYLAMGINLPSLTVEGEDPLRYEEVQGHKLLLIDTQTDKVIMKYENPYEIQKNEFARRWYLNGYINQDAATADGGVKNPRMWMKGGSGKPGTEDSFSSEEGKPYGRGIATPPVISSVSLSGSMLTIPRSSVDKERAMMFIDMLYTDEYLLNLMQFGIEGTHYVKNSNGTIGIPNGFERRSDVGYYPATEWVVGNQFLNYLFETENPDKWEEYRKYNESAVMAKSAGFIFDPVNVKTEVAALSTVTGEYERLIVTGTIDTKQGIADMTEKMKAVGLDKIVDEAQRQYDEWRK